MEEIDISADGKIICEPCGRNTAPAILLGMLDILKHEEDAILCIFPADHVIKNVGVFHEKLRSAIKLAEMGYIVTFGIKPHYPETGYGYIEGAEEIKDQAFAVKRFVEKPDMETARRYVGAGSFFWNSGMFTFKASVMMNELKIHQPELLEKMQPLILTEGEISKEGYQLLPNIAIDHAIMEKTDKGAVLPSDFGWSDIGSWKSLYDFSPKDKSSNVIDGDVIAINTKNCLIMGNERLVATNNIKNIVVIETPDSVFVSDMETSRDVKSIVQKLKEKDRREYYQHMTEYHPWGTLTLLEKKDNFIIEKLILYPGSKLEIKVGASVNKHLVVVRGQAKTTTKKHCESLNRGQSIMFNEKQAVKLENPGEELLEIVNVELDFR
jgi:mannose-1-phosphate guanylyltransferase/mannose-6-phosphate isomerase